MNDENLTRGIVIHSACDDIAKIETMLIREGICQADVEKIILLIDDTSLTNTTNRVAHELCASMKMYEDVVKKINGSEFISSKMKWKKPRWQR